MSWSRAGMLWVIALALVGIVTAMRLSASSSSIDAVSVIWSGDPAQVNAIGLTRGDESWRFERTDSGWRQTEPFVHRVNGLVLEDLLDRVDTLEVMRSIEQDAAGLDRVEGLGLDPPRVSVDLEDSSGTTRLNLGRRGLAGRAWMRLGDGPVLVVSRDLHDLLIDEHPTAWRDLQVFPDTTIDIDRIERTVSGETMLIERAGRMWTIVEPLRTRADADMVMAHIGEIAGVRASTVLLDEPPDSAAFGLEPPVARVVVTAPSGATALRIGDRLGGTTQDRYAMVEGIDSVVQLPERDVIRLLGDPAALVARTGTGATVMDVHGVRIGTDDGELLLERSLDTWVAPELGGAPVAGGAVEHLLELLSRTEAVEVTLLEQYPRELEVAVITLLDRTGGPIDTVRVLREPGDVRGPGRFGLENGDRVVRILSLEHQVPIQASDFALTP